MPWNNSSGKYVVNDEVDDRSSQATGREQGGITPTFSYKDSASQYGGAVSTVRSVYPDSNPAQVVDVITTNVGIFGWKKKCLYLTVLFLVCLSILNLGLIVWVMRIMDVHDDAAGPLHFEHRNLHVQGRAEFTQGIVAHNISSVNETSMMIQSPEKVVLIAKNAANRTYSTMVMDGKGVDIETAQLRLIQEDQEYLVVSPSSTVISSRQMVVKASSGLAVEGAIQTTSISNSHTNGLGLTIESVAQDLSLKAGRDVLVQSDNAALSIKALLGINIESSDIISLSGTGVEIPNLPASSQAASSTWTLCVCDDGRLFRVPGSQLCSAGSAQVCV